MLPMWTCSARRRLDGDLQTFCTILHRSAPAPAPHLGGYIGTGCRADNRAAQLLEVVTAVTSAAYDPSVSQSAFTITEKTPTGGFKTLC